MNEDAGKLKVETEPSVEYPKAKPQDGKEPDRRQSDYKADSDHKRPAMTPPPSERHDQVGKRRETDIDSERHPEEQITEPIEFTRKDKNLYNEKSDRV